ncbi:hypothetical protein COOONC_01117 [Cooperia oncophora]
MEINSPQEPPDIWDSSNSLQYSESGSVMSTQMPTSHHPHHIDAPAPVGLYNDHQASSMPYSPQSWCPQMPPHFHSSEQGMYAMHNYYTPQYPPYLPPNPDYSQRYDQYISSMPAFTRDI